MDHSIIHYRTTAYHKITAHHSSCAIAAELPNSQTISLWHKSLREMGFDLDADEPTSEQLFELVKAAFEGQKGKSLNITFSKSYIASLDGLSPIPANEASRLYSGRNEVYVDDLVLSVLFEYIAAYYIWAKDYMDKDTYSFCFRYVVTLLNYAWRLGILSNDEHEAQLVSQIVAHCDIRAVNLITDLYWSCIAFAFCHEIAHIYLNHGGQRDKTLHELWQKEYEADAVGYEVYLKIIETVKEEPEMPFTGIFHDYLYVAPMILFQFYEDTYFLGYWLFGEQAGNSHPPLDKRAEALLHISERPQYIFETKEGNILLNNYKDVSDWLREQLILKLQKGKLHGLIQKGFAFMSKSGYQEALQFQEDLCNDLQKIAETCNVKYDQLMGLWDTAVDIELLDTPSENAFIWSYKEKTYSSKLFNVQFSLKKVLVSVLEFGGTLEIPDASLKTIFTALLILYRIADISTVNLSETHAAVLIRCYELHANTQPISEEILLQVPGSSSVVITELSKLGCIDIVEGMVKLKEKILVM